MMKRYLSLLLLGLATTWSSMAQEAFTEGDFSYQPTGSATVSVAACTLGEGALAVIPETVTHEGTAYTVTAIGDEAFKDSPVAAVSMPATVTAIGNNAFANCDATFINLSPNVKTMGEGAFAQCSVMGHLNLPPTVERLESSLCSGTPLYSLGGAELPRPTYVGDNALAGTHLRAFPLSDAVTYLGAYAFSGSRLQNIHLPAGLTELSDGVLKGCYGITEVALPAGITRIGKEALAGTAIRTIDLAHYQGDIDILAFNGCRLLDRLTLPADNPYCYTSDDGKVLYSRATKDLLTVLPTVERLTVPYPAAGVYSKLVTHELMFTDPETGEEFYRDEYDTSYFLDGEFSKLRQLELPHSWWAPLDKCYFPQLEELTLRMSETGMFWSYNAPNIGSYEKPCVVSVFPYARERMQTNSPWKNLIANNCITVADIDRPTEELYVEEVLPMYDKESCTVEDGKVVVYDGDWNTIIEEAYPQYYTSNPVSTSRYDFKQLFRDYLLKQYMTPDHFRAYDRPDDTVLKCINGEIHLATGFDAGNFTNWFLQSPFIPASDYVGANELPINTDTQTTAEPFAADPAWGLPVENGYLFSVQTLYPSAYFALHMVPNVTYDIYAIVPPVHPTPFTDDNGLELQSYRNRIRSYLTYVAAFDEETGVGKTSIMSGGNIDLLYESEKVDTVLLFEGVQVISDVYNVLEVASVRITNSLRRQGYITSFPLLGILCQPREELPVCPDAVDGIQSPTLSVVARYDLSGRRLTAPQRGINILQMSDGSTRKVMVK